MTEGWYATLPSQSCEWVQPHKDFNTLDSQCFSNTLEVRFYYYEAVCLSSWLNMEQLVSVYLSVYHTINYTSSVMRSLNQSETLHNKQDLFIRGLPSVDFIVTLCAAFEKSEASLQGLNVLNIWGSICWLLKPHCLNSSWNQQPNISHW